MVKAIYQACFKNWEFYNKDKGHLENISFVEPLFFEHNCSNESPIKMPVRRKNRYIQSLEMSWIPFCNKLSHRLLVERYGEDNLSKACFKSWDFDSKDKGHLGNIKQLRFLPDSRITYKIILRDLNTHFNEHNLLSLLQNFLHQRQKASWKYKAIKMPARLKNHLYNHLEGLEHPFQRV